VAAVCRHGEPLALFAYSRDREYPLSGGVSVVRRSIPLPDRLRDWVTGLLRASCWHGVAMVEFKYDPRTDDYVLMEINGRFQASTALSLDAGLNLPELVVRVFTGQPVIPVTGYRIGVRERWLQGDLMALRDRMMSNGHAQPVRPGYRAPSRAAVLRDFLADFRPGTRYDDFRLDDLRPAVIEGATLVRMVGRWVRGAVVAARRRLRYRPGSGSALASDATQRSIRA
jgi:predicted ATP-grasp superfamily ATP-dependent carboligase